MNPMGGILVAAMLSACTAPNRDADASAAYGATAIAAGVVDSMLPQEEALRRFRAGLDTPQSLQGPARRDALLDAFTAAFVSGDGVALEGLLVTKAEFAWLVYPELTIAGPQYRQPPEIAWLLTRAASGGGLRKLLGRSTRPHLEGFDCRPEPERQGALLLWHCSVRLREPANAESRNVRMFGPIVERDGRFRLLSLDSDF